MPGITPVGSIKTGASTGYALMPDGKSALLCDGIHSLPDGRLLKPLALQGVVGAVDPTGRFALTLFKETIQVWDLTSGQKVRDCAGSLNPPVQVSFSPDGKSFVSAGDRFARVWDAAAGNCIQKLKKHETQTFKARYSPDGKAVVSLADNDYQLKLWEPMSGVNTLTITMPGHEGGAPWMDMPHDVMFSRDGKTLVAGSCTLCVFDSASGQFLIEVPGDGGHFSALTTHPDGKTVFCTVFYMEGDQVSAIVLRALDLETGSVAGEVPVTGASNLHLTANADMLLAEAVESVEVFKVG